MPSQAYDREGERGPAAGLFGRSLKVLETRLGRRDRRLTYGEMGARFGVSRQVVSRWVNGEVEVPLTALLEVCKWARMSPEAMLHRLAEDQEGAEDPAPERRVAGGGGRLRVVLGSLAATLVLLLIWLTGSFDPHVWYAYIQDATRWSAPQPGYAGKPAPQPASSPAAAVASDELGGTGSAPSVTPAPTTGPDAGPGGSRPPSPGAVAVTVQQGDVGQQPRGVAVAGGTQPGQLLSGSLGEGPVNASGGVGLNGTVGCAVISEQGRGVKVCGTISPQQVVQQVTVTR